MKEIRYTTKLCEYTRWQRLKIWLENIRDEICESPPKTYSRFIEVKPGDPEYEKAPWVSTVVTQGAGRYEFVDGEYRSTQEAKP